MIHQGVCRDASALTAPGLVLPRTFVGEQLKGSYLSFRGQGDVLNSRLSGGTSQHCEAEQKSQKAQSEVSTAIGILPLMPDERMPRRLSY